MAEYIVQGDSVKALGDAIREKTGKTEPMLMSEMVNTVKNDLFTAATIDENGIVHLPGSATISEDGIVTLQ